MNTLQCCRVDSLHDGADFSLRLSRAKFEELCQDLGLVDARSFLL